MGSTGGPKAEAKGSGALPARQDRIAASGPQPAEPVFRRPPAPELTRGRGLTPAESALSVQLFLEGPGRLRE